MRKFLSVIFIIAGSFLILNAVAMPFITNYNVGIIPQGMFAVLLIICGIFIKKIKKMFTVFISLISTVLIFFSSFLAVYGINDTVTYNEDVMIVLGAAVEGEELSPNLRKRLEKAVEYYEKNPEVKIIVSGGMGEDEDISEALAMERYLVKNGIPSDKITKEDKSTSTYENFLFSCDLIDENSRALFITNRFHVFRANKIAESMGINISHMGADIEWYTVPMNYFREMMAVVNEFVIK